MPTVPFPQGRGITSLRESNTTMGKIAIIPEDCRSAASYLSHQPLPLEYMSDYSVLGLRVNRYRQALEVLRESGFPLSEKNGGADVGIDGPQSVQKIRSLLNRSEITSEIADIADTLYQA